VENRDAVLARLRSIGMVTRDVPDDATLTELARVAAKKLSCPGCEGVGLLVEHAPDDDAELWGDPIPCEVCGKMIPAERLAVFPDSKVCTLCQGKLDRGESVGKTEYCPRCGSPMTLRASRGSGITRYQLVCSLGSQCRR
jgi:hypothetical protein